MGEVKASAGHKVSDVLVFVALLALGIGVLAAATVSVNVEPTLIKYTVLSC